MQLSIFSIYDTVAQEYGPIWLSKNEITALRQYKSHLATLADHLRNDFVLHFIGEFDNQTGQIYFEASDSHIVREKVVENATV